MDIVKKSEKKCTKCKVYKERKDFYKSKGWVCDDCFAVIENNLDIKKGDTVHYVSPLTFEKQEMIVTEEPKKLVTSYYIWIKPKGITDEVKGSKTYLGYIEKI